jgi:hypothetical protein
VHHFVRVNTLHRPAFNSRSLLIGQTLMLRAILKAPAIVPVTVMPTKTGFRSHLATVKSLSEEPLGATAIATVYTRLPCDA